MDDEQRENNLNFAYKDVKNAFLYYAENSDKDRLLILAGFSQGSDMVLRLMEGACFTDYSGSITKEIPNLTGAYIDETRGTLKVTDINAEDYSNSLFEDGIYHLYDYQFFYRNLEENVAVRLDAYNNK